MVMKEERLKEGVKDGDVRTMELEIAGKRLSRRRPMAMAHGTKRDVDFETWGAARGDMIS
jgi:hypothetical protein